MCRLFRQSAPNKYTAALLSLWASNLAEELLLVAVSCWERLVKDGTIGKESGSRKRLRRWPTATGSTGAAPQSLCCSHARSTHQNDLGLQQQSVQEAARDRNCLELGVFLRIQTEGALGRPRAGGDVRCVTRMPSAQCHKNA